MEELIKRPLNNAEEKTLGAPRARGKNFEPGDKSPTYTWC